MHSHLIALRGIRSAHCRFGVTAMKHAKTKVNRGKAMMTAVLCVMLGAAVFLSVLGLKAAVSSDGSSASSDEALTAALALKAEADELYDEMIGPALLRAEEAVREGSTEAARKLLADEWETDQSELQDESDEAVWKLLAMAYSVSRKKLSSSQRKSLGAISSPDEARDHMLMLLASGGDAASDPVLSGVSVFADADTALLMQVFLSSGNQNGTVLEKDTALAFARAFGKDSSALKSMKQVTGENVSFLKAWISGHAKTIALTGILLLIDTVLLWFFLRTERSFEMDFKWILILLIVDFLLVFQLLPLLYLIVKAFFPNGSFSLQTFSRLYTYRMNWEAIKNTLIAAICTMFLGTFIAFPLAWLVGRTNLYGRKLFRFIFVLTYMVPPYVGAMAWLRLLNQNAGTINLVIRRVFNLTVTRGPFNIYSLGGMIWVMTTFYYPYAFITISRAMEKMDPSLEEASRISGANALMTVLRVTLPMMRPSLIAGALLVFIGAASCYGIPSIIGAPGNVHTVTTRINEYYGLGVQGINDATGLAVFLVLIAVLVLYFSDIVVSKKQFITVSGKSVRPNTVDLGKWRLPLFLLVLLFSVIAVVIPFCTIIAASFKFDVGKTLAAEGNFTLMQWKALIRRETFVSLRNSLIYGIAAASAGIIISCTMSYLLQRTRIRGRKIPDFLITLGSGTPSVVIALGLILTMRGQFGVNIYGTASILIIAYMIKYLMMGMRTVISAMSQIHVSLEECSRISGAGWVRTMVSITGPLILPSIAAGWFLIFIPSFYELSMTALLYTQSTQTIGFQLFQYWTFTSQPQACAMASGILLFVVILNVVMNRITGGEFSI